MGFEFSKYRTAVFSALAVLASAAMIHYAVEKIDSAVYVNTGEADMTGRIIVLDCGHGEYVLSIVI